MAKARPRGLIGWLSLNKSIKPSSDYYVRLRIPKAKPGGRKSR